MFLILITLLRRYVTLSCVMFKISPITVDFRIKLHQPFTIRLRAEIHKLALKHPNCQIAYSDHRDTIASD